MLVVLENPAVPVELIVPVEAVPVQDHPPVLLAVALRTKSVIAAHHPDQVPLLAVEEDLAAAAAETTREPAAAEAAIAWAVADTAAVVAAVVQSRRRRRRRSRRRRWWTVVAAAVAAEDAEDKGTVDEEKTNENKNKYYDFVENFRDRLLRSLVPVRSALSILKAAPRAKTRCSGARNQQEKEFDTPKQAADALVQVATSFDVPPLKEILGPDSEDIIASEDPVQDKNRAAEFAAKAKEKMSVEINKKNPNQAILLVGNDDFPLPIPLVKQKGKWFFDTKVGREEILNRRIGANELNAIQICRGFVEAQHEYALEKHDGSKVNQYAQRIISSPGKHDGLAWQNADGTWGGPVGEEVAKALEQGYSERVSTVSRLLL